ncbi:protease modulator HflK [Sphingomonas sp.]|uniref:protease modulator HflK n=1 Tax=Sphingomonas sp. TaxID=28214 RepID=UPI001B21F8AC|nr:protease modulator HflK [Sphingomonas sp.]MBO9712338.1 protease modulator HflK [Sphingomonas sp.]
MAKQTGGLDGAGILHNEPPKSPWGNGGKNDGNGGSGGGSGGGGGPRNPWNFPPNGKKSRPGAASLDEFIKRARGGGGPGLPGLPSGWRLWAAVVGGLVLIWVIFSSVHVIGPQERGVASLFGRYSTTLTPGFKFTLPAPFMTVDVVDVQNIHTETFPKNSGDNLMLTSDQNIVDLTYSVRWDISNAPDFVFQIADPQETVRATAESAMRAVVATSTLNEAIGDGRSRIEARVQIMMQQILDDYHSGIRIQGVAIQKAGPPSQVDDAFKAVTAAQQAAQANKNNANAYAQQVIAAAQGQAAEFDKLYEQYKLAPEVTRRRMYYETMEAVLQKSDKVIVEAPGVTPYLPIPGLKRPDPQPDQPASQGDAK